jgi:hypothetical protein
VFSIKFNDVESVDGSVGSIYNDRWRVDVLLGSVESVVVCLQWLPAWEELSMRKDRQRALCMRIPTKMG